MKPTVLRNIVRSISIALFLFALTQVCFDTENSPGESGEGAALLISGFFGFFTSLTGLTWLANPLICYSWVQILNKPKHSLLASSIATVISLSFLLCHTVTANEGGETSSITNIRIGYWLWLASMITMVVGNLLIRIPAKKKDVDYYQPPVKI